MSALGIWSCGMGTKVDLLVAMELSMEAEWTPLVAVYQLRMSRFV